MAMRRTAGGEPGGEKGGELSDAQLGATMKAFSSHVAAEEIKQREKAEHKLQQERFRNEDLAAQVLRLGARLEEAKASEAAKQAQIDDLEPLRPKAERVGDNFSNIVDTVPLCHCRSVVQRRLADRLLGRDAPF